MVKFLDKSFIFQYPFLHVYAVLYFCTNYTTVFCKMQEKNYNSKKVNIIFEFFSFFKKSTVN